MRCAFGLPHRTGLGGLPIDLARFAVFLAQWERSCGSNSFPPQMKTEHCRLARYIPDGAVSTGISTVTVVT